MTTASIDVRGLKVSTLIPPGALPPSLVPPEPNPAGVPVLVLCLDGTVQVHAPVNGKSIRKALKLIAAHGVDGVNVILQGILKPPAAPGEPFELECAGLTATVKTPAPAAPAG